MWELRNKVDVSFPEIPDGHGLKFFADDGKVKPENVNAIGHVSRKVDEQCLETNSSASADVGGIFTGPQSDAIASAEAQRSKQLLNTEEESVQRAREGRATAFAAAAEGYGVSLSPDLLACDVAKYAAPDEVVVSTLKIVNITGMPATTQNITVHGSIEVALVRGKDDKGYPRLLFSVAQGTAQLTVHEKFTFWQNDFTRATDMSGEYNPCGICACCFPCLTVSAGAASTYSSNNTKGSFFYDYSISREITNQFSYLPLQNTLIDAMAYNESKAHFKAKAGDDNQTSSSGTVTAAYENHCFKNCCMWECCKCDCACNCSCMACLTCTCIKCPKCPSCCPCCKRVGNAKIGISTTSKTVDYVDTFDAKEDHVVGKEPALHGFTSGEDEGVEWSVTKELTNDVFVVLQYRSMHDNKQHVCKMQVKHSKTAYADARTFVSAVGSNRCPFFTHPAYDVNPVGTFGQLGGATNASSGFGIGGLGGVMGAAGAFSLASMDVEVTTSDASADSMCFRMWYFVNYYYLCCCLDFGE